LANVPRKTSPRSQFGAEAAIDMAIGPENGSPTTTKRRSQDYWGLTMAFRLHIVARMMLWVRNGNRLMFDTNRRNELCKALAAAMHTSRT